MQLELSKMELFVITVYGHNLLTIITNSFILDVTRVLAYCIKLRVRV